MIKKEDRVSVLGLGKSGVAAAKLLAKMGAKVEVFEQKKAPSDSPEAIELQNLGIPVHFGAQVDQIVHEQSDWLVKNPGVPYHNPAIQRAVERSIPVITEVELASSVLDVPIIGITGSNGKTTTTTIVGEMLDKSGVPALVAGNIGRALSDAVEDTAGKKWIVTELSSFQLKGTKTFHPQIAALLNVVAAHLDYHQSLEDYVESKAKLFRNLDKNDIAVFNFDNDLCRKVADLQEGTIYWFSIKEEVDRGLFVRDGWMIARMNGEEQAIMPLSEIALPGDKNLENALAAAAISLAAGANKEAIRSVLQSFTGVEHRLEYVSTKNNVRYYNDSKATNAGAAITALTAFSEPLIWIGGGLDRGVDFQELVPFLREHVKVAIVYGETASILADRANDAGISKIVHATDVEDAVRHASKIATDGDIVVLSPACASWDQYPSFEVRGSIFKQAVHTL
ncbi:UDP-N-acetylmuramoyl-L-alanine--D-glutamate ligase [Shimazuella sp. AN120528]|uniref:UDP-N-acetylmuramoyl-L-alanine--D-glutamate ligase n=1 Tax=Shimazuella soli TaxID=1892854 RepID=UPI001F0CE22C|nr:UDP-N-acetylmuramoyl-L-alanine--D-glutamate ligase [Shimazuella soli]MCH5584703.1 UDP-N-acetylmuramoyl-L-alanine--D-glutamate ligase [Shimazuella soli]